MTTVQIQDEGAKVIIDITGHAGFYSGNDIVCAAVSSLSYTLMQRIRDMDDYGAFNSVTIQRDSGEVHIIALVKKDYRSEFDITLVTVLTGFELLRQKYPNNVFLDLLGGRRYERNLA